MSFMKDQNYDETLDLLHNLDSASTNHGMVKRNESQLRQWCKFASFHLEHSGSTNEKNIQKFFTISILKVFQNYILILFFTGLFRFGHLYHLTF